MVILIKAVIFDIGGVTIKEPMSHVYKAAEKKFGVSWERIKKEDEKLDPLTETCGISSREYISRLSKALKISDASSFRKVWVTAFKRAELNKGVVRIIERVKEMGFKVATISNTIRLHESVHAKRGDYKFFDRVFLSTRLRMRKPEARIYFYAAKNLGVKPEECVFIDNMIENVRSARKTGMKAILFKNSNQLGKDLKVYL